MSSNDLVGGGGGGASSSRRSLSLNTKKSLENGLSDATHRRSISSRASVVTAERTVKRLRLSKALTIPESTTIQEACRRMAARRVDALLLTDSNALLCGILTDKDIATRVVARELNLEETPVSKVMTRNPVFVLSDTLAVEALQKMVQGKFRHLPVVEKGEVIALLDIAKCLYDAIARLERAAEKGKAIAAAVEGVEKHWGASISGPNTFIETLRERMFKPSLSTIIPENSKIVTVSPTDTVLTAAKKMLELKLSSAVVTVDDRPRGILTSKDILMRVIAPNLSPDTTLVEKVMTPNPECATVDTPIVDALHTMHDGKFLHLPVVDRDGKIVSVIDVIHITHAAVATVGSSGAGNEVASNMMQKFWDSAMMLGPFDEDEDSRSEGSLKLQSEGTEPGRSSSVFPSPSMPNMFGFKIQDKKGRMHRFNCDTSSLTELITSILQRLGDDIDPTRLPQILYEDEDHDKVMLASDSDLAAAVDHAKQVGWKGLKLHLDYSGAGGRRRGGGGGSLEHAHRDAWANAYSTVAAGAALVAGLGVLAYLKRAGS
ncbi:CBS domain-containing protein CBSCBSPB1-like [Papaver somniferum]|uniref:CBS domain-containing protein CBSCBSPB1-like n=1 Tax=Papaver somniferum TaxID=3469 RepID=UPI000E7032E9|nr:CBS domain-containing protein CBSCBSPB1-like [Papaver somniferum]